jgi:hypothetical protein
MFELADAAEAAAVSAAEASSISEIKRRADEVFAFVWGQSSGLVDRNGAASMRGWKSRWQVTFTDFDAAFGERYGGAAPDEADPAQLGIAGRGRYVRRYLATDANDSATRDRLVASLNNVIGWMRIDDGVTKAERQPRVDLTYQWDAPKEFWQSSSDTGWLFEVQAQALNILKSSYGEDLATARAHAEDLARLVRKCRDGVDADGDGTISATRMEGGLAAVRDAAREEGLL